MEREFLQHCTDGNLEGVNECSFRGVDVNYNDELGDTAALLASFHGHTECVRILADTKRVDWSKADRDGWTPLYMALGRGHSDIMDIIVRWLAGP